MLPRFLPDTQKYNTRIQNGPCFICQIIGNNPDYPHHIVYEDDVAIAFLDRFPTPFMAIPWSRPKAITSK